MLTVTQLPGIYIQKDKGIIEVFDHLNARILKRDSNRIELQISNPTRYDAEVKIYVETSGEARKKLYSLSNKTNIRNVRVKGNDSVTIIL